MITSIKNALSASAEADIEIAGWIRSRRDSKAFSFLEINDGSCLRSLQVIVDQQVPGYEQVLRATTGSSARVKGRLTASPAAGQKWELHATQVEIVGGADAAYPLQKKGHTVEFLRTIAHLRPRSNLFGAVFRVRSRLAYAVHHFFQERDFMYVQTPIITASDCEGAGELFRVTKLEPGKDKSNESDFFGKATYLTVSGQLEAETFACALSKVYTFGPTFRAENSNTSRHAAEFWMIEPEMAFCDLQGDMDLAEEFVKAMVRHALEHCEDELGLFTKFVDKDLMARLILVAENPFQRIPYAEAISILNASGRNFEYPVTDGQSLQSEHERYLAEEHFRVPVILFDQPRQAKPFYMRVNDDGGTVAAMDVLVASIGEIIGGSQREERLNVLQENMRTHGLSEEEYWWYLDLRRFGTVPHAGFGLGFERLLMFVTGVSNIRDVIPFARTPGSAEF
jgi:asparaginyl-tRNA synthetase